MLLKYIQPSINILNIRIDEPVTTATNILITVICFYAFSRIEQLGSTGRIKRYFMYYFLSAGLGALFGGLLGHAFLYRISPQWKLVSWVFSMIAVTFMIHALLELAKPLVKSGIAKLLVLLNLLTLIAAIFFTSRTLAFSPVKYYSIFGMVVIVGSLCYFIFQKTGSRGVLKIAFAVGLGLPAAIIFSFGWGFSPWFNHKDISHMILSGSALFFYQGAALILNSARAQA